MHRNARTIRRWGLDGVLVAAVLMGGSGCTSTHVGVAGRAARGTAVESIPAGKWSAPSRNGAGSPEAGYAVVPSKAQVLAELAISDAYVHEFTTVRDNYPVVSGAHVLDPFGRTLAFDLQHHCMPPAEQQGLVAERARLVAAIGRGDLASAGVDARAFAQHVAATGKRCNAVGLYWRLVVSAPDWGPYWEMLIANHLRVHSAAKLGALTAQLNAEERHGQYVKAMMGTWPQLQRLRAAALAEDRADVAKRAKAPGFRGLYELRVTTPCVPAARTTSGTKDVALDPRYPAPAPVFPPRAEARWQSGSVMVGIVVSPHGCVRSAFVLESSGFALLDRAAVAYAVRTRYLPAERDGRAIEQHATLPISFNLHKPSSGAGG